MTLLKNGNHDISIYLRHAVHLLKNNTSSCGEDGSYLIDAGGDDVFLRDRDFAAAGGGDVLNF